VYKVLITLLLVFGVTSAKAQPQWFKIRPLEGFFLDNKVPLKKGLNFFVIRDRKKFISWFGQINKPDTPNFDYVNVVVMALPPSKKYSQIGFYPNAAKAGTFIEIYCSVDKNQFELTYTAYPIVVATIPKYFSVTKVNFYNAEDKKLLASVPVK
jgi:hypothetical protein